MVDDWTPAEDGSALPSSNNNSRDGSFKELIPPEASINYDTTAEEEVLPGKDSHGHQLQRARSRYVTVEVPLLLISLAISVVITLLPEYIRARIAVDEFNQNQTANSSVSECQTNSTTDDEIQKETARWMLWLGAAGALPGLFTAMFLGSFSDRIGRKPSLFLCALGEALTCAGSIVIVKFHLPLVAFVPVELINSIFGGMLLALATSAAYVTDVTSPNWRTFRIIIVETTLFLGLSVGQLALGFALQLDHTQSTTKFLLPLWIALACSLVSMAYVAVPWLLIETVDRKTSDKLSKIPTEIYHLLKENTNGRRKQIFLYSVIIMFAEFSVQSFAQISVVYCQGRPFCFSSLEISYISIVSLVSASLGMIGGGALMPRCMSENWILQVSFVHIFLSCLVTGLAKTKLVLYIGAGIGFLKPLSFPVIRSQLSKLAAPHERGLMLAFIGAAESGSSFLAPIVSNSIYRATIGFFSPFTFFFLGAIQLVPAILTGILQCDRKPASTYSPLEEEERTN
ncbi:proton-coupled folate transporter-like [Diadema antillarum]|uniref:proton-coupled folate transporter-like n=1 Tax=Diadema antillarum TaxID=105358 RepID=UPI003A8B4380